MTHFGRRSSQSSPEDQGHERTDLGPLGASLLPGSGAEGREGRREVSKIMGSDGTHPKMKERSSLDGLHNCFFHLGTPGVKSSIRTCKPVRFPIMGLRFNFLMLSQAWGWGERACVLATEDAEGSVGRPGRRGGCSSLRFTKAARLTLAESLPAARRPGDSSWSSSALPGEPAGLTLVAGTKRSGGACACARGRLRTPIGGLALCPSPCSPAIWGQKRAWA